MSDPVYFVIEDDSYICMLYGEKIDVGNTVSFLIDNDAGTLLKYGNTDIVKDCQNVMYHQYTLGAKYMPEEFRKLCADMKEALRVVTFKKGEVPLDLLNQFINCTGSLKVWLDKKDNS